MARGRQGSLLEKRLKELHFKVMEDIATGVCIDFAQYRDQCGYMRGIEDAIALLEEIEKESGN